MPQEAEDPAAAAAAVVIQKRQLPPPVGMGKPAAAAALVAAGPRQQDEIMGIDSAMPLVPHLEHMASFDAMAWNLATPAPTNA